MQWKTGLALALFAQGSAAQMIRFGCSQLLIARLDPLVNPGDPLSPHLHQIVGGNSFNVTMDPATHDLPTDSTCTSCTYSQDFSNYWTAVLYYKARNGSYTRVHQFSNGGIHGIGGVTVYYIPPYDGKTLVTAFKPGFRMLVGDANLRTAEGMQKQLCNRCESATGVSGGAPCTGADTQTLPKGFCTGGIRVTTTFPTCWDGVNIDSPDHKSHIAYPSSGSFETGGPCPTTHPVKLPQVMYEVMWDTRPFNTEELWGENGTQPFVWSTGDDLGYSAHGDYMFGWEGDTLQNALNERCGNAVCDQLDIQTSDDAMQCMQSQEGHEDVDGWSETLPGNITAGS